MFCARCGEHIPDSSVTCPLCGREASLHVDQQAAGPAAAAAPAPEKIQRPDEPQTISLPARQPGLKGVDGWLLVFCILLILVNPLAVFLLAWSTGFGEESLFYLVWAIYGFVVGVMLWSVHRAIFVLLWIYFGITLLIDGLAIVGMATSEEKASGSEITLTLRGLIYTVVWFLYFKKSDRVQATFGKNL